MILRANETTHSSLPFYTEDKLNIIVTKSQPEFSIQLKSNPTTGFSWFLREYDDHIIVPVKRTYQKANAKLIGSSGNEIWIFKVKPEAFAVPQQTTIRLIYARPWENRDSTTPIVFRVTTQDK